MPPAIPASPSPAHRNAYTGDRQRRRAANMRAFKRALEELAAALKA
jgi:hypothetical protein